MRYVLSVTVVTIAAVVLTGLSAVGVQAQPRRDKGALKEIIQKELNQKTKLVGTFDLYEEATRRVRNLRIIRVEEPIDDKDGLRVPVKFRDTASGDIVMVEAKLAESGGAFKVADWTIAKVESAGADIVKKESYSDEEVRQLIFDYLEKQTKFTDHLMLFDPKIENMRKLELVQLTGELRRFGILTIETGVFRDLDSNETLTIDILVKNKKGVLEVDSLKIRKVKK